MSRITIDPTIITANINAIRTVAPYGIVANGREWYASAYHACVTMADTYDIPLGSVADCLSVLSPQKAWSQNVAECAAFLRDYRNGLSPVAPHAGMRGAARPFCTRSQRVKLDAILSGGAALQGQKVESFRDNIIHNASSQRVTVDSWAMRIARCDASNNGLVTSAQYPIVEECYAHVARAFAEQPMQTQAITWVLYRALYATHHAVVTEIQADAHMRDVRANVGAYVAMIDGLRGT